MVFGCETPEEYKSLGFGIFSLSFLRRLKFHIVEKSVKGKTKKTEPKGQIMRLVRSLSLQYLVHFLLSGTIIGFVCVK